MLALLLPLSVLLLIFSVFLFTLGAWLKALSYALGAEFIAAGAWLCVGIFMVNALNVLFNDDQWADFTPMYIFVMIFAVGARC